MNINTGGPSSVVSIATGYGLDGQRIESRCGEIFRTCPDRPWGPPNLLYNGYRVFPRGKERLMRDTDPSPLSSAICHERVELYLYSPYGPYGLYKGALYLLYKHRHICVYSYVSFIIIYGNVTDGNFSDWKIRTLQNLVFILPHTADVHLQNTKAK
jgi:hypothetical protein